MSFLSGITNMNYSVTSMYAQSRSVNSIKGESFCNAVIEHKGTGVRATTHSTVDDYLSRHPENKAQIDRLLNPGFSVMQQYGKSDAEVEEMSMDEYKEYIYGILDKLPYHPSQMRDIQFIDITEKGWEQMKNDPDYEAWVLGYTAEDRSVNIPFASMPGYSPSYHTEKFGASIEEHLGQGIPMNSSGKRSLFASNEESWWEKRHERLEKLQKEQEQRAEKRAVLRRKEQQEMLNEKIAKQEQERSRFLQSWNNERKMSQVSAVYEANVMTDFAEGSNYVG